MEKKTPPQKNGALLIAIGIFLSRIAGLLRERAFAHYFGNSDAGDAFKAALKIPNFLQNLFGEGVLSASFIPVYAETLAHEHNQKNPQTPLESKKVASIIGTLLFFMSSILVVLGIFLTPFLIDTIAPGFAGEKRELTIKLVQIFFPGTGLVAMSAWCLGILNSHGKFLLSYTAPVLWNVAIIIALILGGNGPSQFDLAIIGAKGLLIGSFLQLIIQLPTALKLLGSFSFSIDFKNSKVRLILKNFLPSLVSRGVVQISSYIDNILASLLATGSVSFLAYAQTLYMLPVSLFGMSLSASELPEMSALIGAKEEIYSRLKMRLENATLTLAFFIIPSAVAFIFLGDVIVAALFQSGHFREFDTHVVWIVLIGSSVGLLASTTGRLYSSAFYSLKDPRTTLKVALIRISLASLLGYSFSFVIIPQLQVPLAYRAVGLTLASGLSGLLEFYLLRHYLQKVVGRIQLSFRHQIKLWSLAIFCAVIALFVKIIIVWAHPIFRAIVVLGIFGVMYLSICSYFKITEAQKFTDKIMKKLKGKL